MEYAWGYAKRKYRSFPLEKKKCKPNVDNAIKESVRAVTRESINKFAARCRGYMLAYLYDAKQTEEGEADLTFEGSYTSNAA